MPEFVHPFAGLAADRKVTNEELVRAIRFSIAAEYEAIQLYMQLAESTDNPLAQAVLKDIADEEVIHAGEFLRLLQELDPREAALYAEGSAEVEEIAAMLAGTNPAASPENTATASAATEASADVAAPQEGSPAEAMKGEVKKAPAEQQQSRSSRGIGDLFAKP